jgi:hypothetical protein
MKQGGVGDNEIIRWLLVIFLLVILGGGTLLYGDDFLRYLSNVPQPGDLGDPTIVGDDIPIDPSHFKDTISFDLSDGGIIDLGEGIFVFIKQDRVITYDGLGPRNGVERFWETVTDSAEIKIADIQNGNIVFVKGVFDLNSDFYRVLLEKNVYSGSPETYAKAMQKLSCYEVRYSVGNLEENKDCEVPVVFEGYFTKQIFLSRQQLTERTYSGDQKLVLIPKNFLSNLVIFGTPWEAFYFVERDKIVLIGNKAIQYLSPSHKYYNKEIGYVDSRGVIFIDEIYFDYSSQWGLEKEFILDGGTRIRWNPTYGAWETNLKVDYDALKELLED